MTRGTIGSSTLIAGGIGVALGVGLTSALDCVRRCTNKCSPPSDDNRQHELTLSDRGKEIHRHLVETQKPATLLGIHVDRYDGGGDGITSPTLVLSAPLDRNTNVHGTAFAGSLYSVAVLCGYYVVHAWLRDGAQHDDLREYVLVARSASINYRRPVAGCGRIVAQSALPPKAVMDGFRATLLAKGKADLDATATICLDVGTLACECDVTLCSYRRRVEA